MKIFVANEPHSETANSPHSSGACENPADKKEPQVGEDDERDRGWTFVFRRGGRGEGWLCLLGQERSLLGGSASLFLQKA